MDSWQSRQLLHCDELCYLTIIWQLDIYLRSHILARKRWDEDKDTGDNDTIYDILRKAIWQNINLTVPFEATIGAKLFTDVSGVCTFTVLCSICRSTDLFMYILRLKHRVCIDTSLNRFKLFIFSQHVDFVLKFDSTQLQHKAICFIPPLYDHLRPTLLYIYHFNSIVN